MTVYGEFLFAENFITGMVILLLTGKLCSRQNSKSGILLGSLMCGVYSFVLFIPMVWPAALLCRLLFSFLVILGAFGYGSRVCCLKTTAVFYIVSFLMGGVTIALMYLTKVPGLSANGSVYLHGITYLQVATGVLATWVLGSWLADFIRGKLQREKVYTSLEVEIGEKRWELCAFVDTGNFLKDPVSGRPAVVLSATFGQRLMAEMAAEMKELLICRTCVIPYRCVGQKGVLQGVRPDRIIVQGQSIEQIVLAVSREDFTGEKGRQPYEALLQQQLLEGGLLEDAQ